MQNGNFISGVCMVHIIQGVENHYISADLHQVFDTCPLMDEVSQLSSWFTIKVTLKFFCYKYSTHNDKLYFSFMNDSHHHQPFLIQHLKPLPPRQGPITNIKEISKTSDNQNLEVDRMIQLFEVIETSSSSCKSQAPWVSNKLTYT